jgi:hypothetical protein
VGNEYMRQIRKSMAREERIKKIDKEFKIEKDRIIPLRKDFYYEFKDLIGKDIIFSKLHDKIVSRLYTGEYASLYDHVLSFFKNLLIIPVLLLWKIFLIKFEYLYYKRKYPEMSTLENIKNENFDYLFVLNTKDHIISALPALENIEQFGKVLVVVFREVYFKYVEDFNRLKNTKILFFDYELKKLPIKRYIKIHSESKNKFEPLKSYKMNANIKTVIQADSNFVKLHLKEELIQYYFFKEIFNSFDLKGVVSIVFTTAFEFCSERNIQTFILDHGIGASAGEGFWPFVSDYIIVHSDLTMETSNEWLDSTVTILPLGSPRFEYSRKVASPKRGISNFNKKIGRSGYKRNVTYISVGLEEFETKRLLPALKKLRGKLPGDVNLIIKLHPRGDYNTKKEIKRIFSKKELRETVFIKKEIDFYEVIANSDVVITTVSTGILESFAMDIPTLQVNFTGEPYPKEYDLSSFGWRTPIDDPDAMITKVLSILGDENRYEEVIKKQNWLKNRMFNNFGNCGKVIAETIVNICNEKR